MLDKTYVGLSATEVQALQFDLYSNHPETIIKYFVTNLVD